jgi:galactokinase/mevalonate kinase-like predicted kinase
VSVKQTPMRPATLKMNILKEPVGKQDQYMAAFGGFRSWTCAGRQGVGRHGACGVHDG